MEPERRVASGIALRATMAPEEWASPEQEPDWPKTVRGYAARFDSWSDDLGGFRERIAPGAFAGVLGNDVRALINHDSNYVLGRSRSGTLRMAEDGNGLAVEIDLPDTRAARDLAASMARGDVDQMSFGFFVDEDDWTMGADGSIARTITKVRELFDVSVVTFPAYPQTEAALRSAGFRAAAAPVARFGNLRARAALARVHGG